MSELRRDGKSVAQRARRTRRAQRRRQNHGVKSFETAKYAKGEFLTANKRELTRMGMRQTEGRTSNIELPTLKAERDVSENGRGGRCPKPNQGEQGKFLTAKY